MNLITDPWIPVRCASGRKRQISPLELGDPTDPPLDLDAVRPDFDGALAQFLVGLMQWLVSTADDPQDHWKAVLSGELPPEFERLRELEPHFHLDSGERRFMQDADFASDKVLPLESLLLEAPGANTLKKNCDLFQKRRFGFSLTSALAAQALLTLQVNAPSGGSGQLTSLRGGGPLTVMLWPERIGDRPASLWQKVWINVIAVAKSRIRSELVFPWTAPCISSEAGVDVDTALGDKQLSEAERLLLCYFATPRRINLQFVAQARCAWSGQLGPAASGYVTRHGGANYLSDRFRHPLVPYRADGNNALPVRPREGGFSYADWWQNQSEEGPRVLQTARLPRALRLKLGHQPVWAFGYAMDNAKVLAWHDSRMPLLDIDDEAVRGRVLHEARKWLDGTELVRKALGSSLRKSWNWAAKGDTSVPERELLDRTEAPFYALVSRCSQLQGDLASLAEQHRALREEWQDELRRVARALFEDHAEQADVAETPISPIERAALAHRALIRSLHHDLPKALELNPTREKAA